MDQIKRGVKKKLNGILYLVSKLLFYIQQSETFIPVRGKRKYLKLVYLSNKMFSVVLHAGKKLACIAKNTHNLREHVAIFIT